MIGQDRKGFEHVGVKPLHPYAPVERDYGHITASVRGKPLYKAHFGPNGPMKVLLIGIK